MKTTNMTTLLNKLSVREKIGQCFTIGFMDTIIKPDTLMAVRQLNCGGLRLVPWEREGLSYQKNEERTFKGGAINEAKGRRMGSAVYSTPKQYASILNRLQKLALARSCGIPLHFSIDQEGDSYNDYTRGGVNLFPSNMGLAALKSPETVYAVYKAVGRQLRALGAHFIHSPVLDVNINPLNPEINFRSFSDDPRIVGELGVAALKGLDEAGVVAVAKHFPGRGNSDEDAHYDFIRYPHNRQRMEQIDLLPYRMLIEKGLRSIMIAHTVYPGLGDAENPASISPVIIGEVLRREMGFQGVITTDSITMAGIMAKYGLAKACELALMAGADLILYRGDVAELVPVLDAMEEGVAKGRLNEQVLDTAISRVWALKESLGVMADPMIKLSEVERPLRARDIVDLSAELPARTAIMIKQGAAFPLTPSTRVLVAEQLGRYAWQCNDQWYHPGMLYEYLWRGTRHLYEAAQPGVVDVVECTMTGLYDLPRVEARISAAEVVVATSYYCRTVPHNIDFIRKLAALGKPVIVVTNQPYLCRDLMFCDTVLLIFSGNPRGLKAVSEILHAKVKPTGIWPLTTCPPPVVAGASGPGR